MADSNNKMRISFPKGEQRRLLERISKKVSAKEMAQICECSERTIRDWRKEKFSMDKTCVEKLCKKATMSFPRNGTTQDRYWYSHKAASLGGQATARKYGGVFVDEKIRLEHWQKWWNTVGQHQGNAIWKPKDIRHPSSRKNLLNSAALYLGMAV